MSFVHLHVHTEYSLLDGSNKISEYVARVKELGMNAAAITDHGVMYGVIDFYKAAKAAGIKPILGCEVYVAPGSRFDRELVNGDDRYYHLVLLAENNKGYSNLIKIVSKGFVEGFYYKPRVDLEVLGRYHEGIIATSACLAGEVQRELVRGNYQGAKEAALRYHEIFGEDHFFLELQDHGMPDQKRVNPQLIRMSQETGLPLVATNDVHYTYAQDAAPHDILLCIQTGKKLADKDRMRYEGGQYYVKSEEEMRSLFPNVTEAIENTQKIADRCQVEIEFGHTKLPNFEVPDGSTTWEYLNKLCFEGLHRRYPGREEELRSRLEYELGVIKDMGYIEYFLIVWDYIRYAREHGIMVGPGRGSAAGSLVAYTTGITDIDPIANSLIFERFLNPERVSMPDIDVDFSDDRRQEVIDYVVEKYGKDCVTQIVTFGTLAARGVIRDVGRVMDLPYAQVDAIAKEIPKELHITIKKALEMNQELRALYEDDEVIHRLLEMSMRLEGLPRHSSTHAAGVVISQKPMDEYVPLALGTGKSVVTQFTMTTIEELGLLKMDFLGLRTLTVIQDAIRMVEESTGETVDLETLDYGDSDVYASIGAGRTEGVFQLESRQMTSFLKEMKPKDLNEVIAAIALYRPGPMAFIPSYLEGRKDPAHITYDCPQLEPILKETYGCIVYQEQVMQIVRDLAGYTMGRSDEVRRAMSKKKTEKMAAERQNFIYGNAELGVKGCIANGISQEIAEKIYDEMIDFAKYAFNKSHAAAYAVVAYQTGYLKYHYPVQFMAALMTSVMGNTSKIAEYIQSCRKMDIKILPPDVNEGYGSFSVSGGCIRFGMDAIKSVGSNVIEAIVKERQSGGDFRTLEDFAVRVSGAGLNKRAMENLIKAGALDRLEGTRKQKLIVYESVMDQAANEKKNAVSGQMSLFDLIPEESRKDFEIRMPDVGEYDKEVLLNYEKEVLGVYISGHPLDDYRTLWERTVTAKTVDFQQQSEEGLSAEDTQAPGEAAGLTDQAHVTLGGMVTESRIIYDKRNRQMAYVTLEDMVGTVELVVFSRTLEQYKDYFAQDARIFVSGKVDLPDDRDGKLIVDRVWLFSDAAKTLKLVFADYESYRQLETRLLRLLKAYRGNTGVEVHLSASQKYKPLGSGYLVQVTKELTDALSGMLGAENVRLVQKNLASNYSVRSAH